MPHLSLQTNVPKSKISQDFLKETTKVIANTLSKPDSYCVVSVEADLPMAWGGSTDPCVVATLMSIGQLGTEANKKHSAAISSHLEKHLGIPKNRLYINFIDAKPADVGHDGTTFHAIFGGK
ncbi:macrophage migration inhibitory factor homolog [Schistocerca serialis cubense]|uniref:macrophage migration inhibitory factor homolog n=1 Tax=Schistocerca serialis cubense TaxID=2023355 RepID=UPI00214E2FE9|nr:macrophage migration inhibitory factor homolog [Schistocerca serialis cubense]